VSQDGATLPLSDKPSIAVLPFTNMSDDSGQEYFVDGLTEDLITDLSKVSGLFVIARSSSFVYKGRDVDIRRVARELSVRYMLEGSVRKAGDRVRINAQLIDATTGGHVWAERYDRQLIGIFELQNEVIERIVAALAVTLTQKETESVTHRSGALAINYYFGVQYGWSTDPQSDMERALTLAEKAVAIDDNIAQVHFALSLAYLVNRNHSEAIQEAQRAIELDPGYADAFALLGWVYCHAGDPQEAFAALENTKRLSPHPNAGTLGVLGLAHFLAGDFEKAIEAYQAGININPEVMNNRIYLTAALSRSGRRDDAEWEGMEILTLNPDFSVDRWTRTQPHKDTDQLSRLRDDLRRAGLPE
jgi:adenylate cyclase